MKIRQFLTTVLLATITLTSSCSKEDLLNQRNKSGGTSGFHYAENGSSTMTKADDAEANSQYKTIMAKKAGATIIEIVLSDIKVGTYSLASKYAFTYVKGGYWEASAGTLTITKNEGGKMSGNFKATAGTGVSGVTSVEGSFTDISVK